MFITLDDNRWVKDPIFYGKEWFLSCKEDCVLTLHVYRNPGDKSLFTRARKVLREAGIRASLAAESSHRHQAAFPPNFRGLKQAASIRLVMGPFPVPAELACHADVYCRVRPGEEIANECIKSAGTASQADQKRESE